MLEIELSELRSAINDLTAAVTAATLANTRGDAETKAPTEEQPKAKPKAKLKAKPKAKPEPETEPEPEPETELAHSDLIPLVQALSKKDRTRAKQIVTTYGERLTAIDVADLPALKRDVEAALAE